LLAVLAARLRGSSRVFLKEPRTACAFALDTLEFTVRSSWSGVFNSLSHLQRTGQLKLGAAKV
jgi:hypothetical protein